MKNYRLRPALSKEQMKVLPYDPLLSELLHARGITEAREAEVFLKPDYETHLYDPFLFADMGKAVDRLLMAIKNGEHIAVFSDYDADGIPGAVALSDFFHKVGHENFVVYIPHRNDEGYGLNTDAIDELAKGEGGKSGATLLITIDCGISNHEEVAHATSLGMDVIVTDHHLPKDTLPQAFAVINHKRSDCAYPDKNLCGSGVIWKIISASLKKGRQEGMFADVSDGYEKWLLDVVGLATLSDMVPLVGENRVLASYGLTVMRKSRRPGLQKLFSLLKMRQPDITEDDIAFLITPRINAASRMGQPKDAFYMLASEDPVEAATLAEHLNKINDERKGVVGSMIRDIKKTIEERKENLRNVIVLGSPEWKPSLLGLVANSFSDEHNRPVFLWGREGGKSGEAALLKGSCRSGGEVHIVQLMEQVKDIFVEYGGHAGAGGFSLMQDNVHILEEKLNEAYEKLQTAGVSTEDGIIIDKELPIESVNWNMYRSIEVLAPFGTGNPKPLFKFPKAEIVATKQFGKEKNHLEIVFKNSAGRNIQAIAFFATAQKFTRTVAVGEKVDLIAHIEKSTFRNFPELRLRIVDIL